DWTSPPGERKEEGPYAARTSLVYRHRGCCPRGDTVAPSRKFNVHRRRCSHRLSYLRNCSAQQARQVGTHRGLMSSDWLLVHSARTRIGHARALATPSSVRSTARAANRLVQETKHGDAVGCAHEHLAVGYGRCNELVPRTELIAAAGL